MFKDFIDVPGWGDARQLFAKTIPSLPPDARLLEIGCGIGRSTWGILDQMSPGMTLSILDSFEYNNDRNYIWNELLRCGSITDSVDSTNLLKDLITSNSQYDIFLTIIKNHINFKFIENIYVMPSSDYIQKSMESQYDFIFIDGDHSYSSVINELEYFKKSKIISGDDYSNQECPGVSEAVNEFVFNHNRNLRLVNGDFLIV